LTKQVTSTEMGANAESDQEPTTPFQWPASTGRVARSPATVREDGAGDLLIGESLCLGQTEMVLRGGDLFIVSSGSDRSVAVNGTRVRGEARLREHDVVTVGDHEIRLRLGSPGEGDFEDATTSVHSRSGTGTTRAAIVDRTISVSDFVSQSRAMRVLSNATADLLMHHPFPVLFDRVLDLVFEAVPAEFAAVILLDSAKKDLVLKAGRDRQGRPVGQRINQAVVRRVIAGRAAALVGDVRDGTNRRQHGRRASDPVHCVICAPLWVANRQAEPVRVIGVLYASAQVDRTPFREADLEILTILANTAAAKIETTYLLEASLEQRRLREELRVAAEIQASLLPSVPVDVPGYELAGRTQSSQAVGGDFYDLAYDGNLLHLALGDVAGKGVGAAMLMVELRSAVRANWQRGPLADAATRINGHFHLSIPADRYATFFLGRLNPDDGRLTYVNAGHNRPLLVGADGRCKTLGEGGTAFGAFADSNYDEAQVSMNPNDTLVVYSDGISDAWPEPGVADRELAQIVRRVSPGSADRIQDAIFEAAEQRTTALPRDDRTLVVVHRSAV